MSVEQENIERSGRLSCKPVNTSISKSARATQRETFHPLFLAQKLEVAKEEIKIKVSDGRDALCKEGCLLLSEFA
jgi:hypothetical protein